MSHAIRIPITTEADDDQSLVLGHDRLVDVPAGDEMGEYDGTHIVCCDVARWLRVGVLVLVEVEMGGCDFDSRFGGVKG